MTPSVLRERAVRVLRALGDRAMPHVVRLLEERAGYHVIKRHYYAPVPDAADLPPDYWQQISSMPGVDLRLGQALDFLEQAVPRHIEGFRARFPLHRTPGQDFFLINGTYMAVDAHVYWCLIQEYMPKRIIEIGAHASTMVATAATAAVAARGGPSCSIHAIEPFPSDYLLREHGRTITLHRQKVQDIPLGMFEELEAGDMLFVDSTHMLRTGSDVQYEFLEVLPRLRPGVFVHVHDVSLPKHYPKVYFDNRIYWNEQYLLQAFLAFNHRFEVVWPGNAMMLAYPEPMQRIFTEYHDMRAAYPSSEPTAFWMRVTAGENSPGSGAR